MTTVRVGRASESGCSKLRAARRGLIVLTVALALSGGSTSRAEEPSGDAGAPAAKASAQEAPGDAAGLEKRLADLEALVARLRAEVERLRTGTERPAPGAGAQAIADLEKRIEALTLELERLRIGAAAAPEAREGVKGFGPAASKVYAARRGVSIGGYGEMLYQNFSGTRDDGTPANATDTADLERAVLYFGYKFNDRSVFNSEIEFEHAVAGAGEPGEVAVEFAYLDYRAARALGVRGGLLLVPVGFLNELHEPPIFFGARRPEVERVIIPSTWRELGFGAYGDAGPVSYRAYLVSSLDASGFTAAEGIREGRQEGAEVKAADLAATARLDYTPAPGIVFGIAGFAGRTGQHDAAIGEPRLSLLEAHADWNWRGLHVRGLYARGTLRGAGRLNAALGLAGGAGVGERMVGWYGEIAYDLLAPREGTAQDLSPFCRYEAFNTQERVAAGFSADPANDRTVLTCGVSYRPIPNIVIKIDAQNYDDRARSAVDQYNLALGYLF